MIIIVTTAIMVTTIIMVAMVMVPSLATVTVSYVTSGSYRYKRRYY